MNACTRHLLALAATTVLTVPLALAQTTTANSHASAQPANPMTAQQAPQVPPSVLSSQTSNSSEALLNTNAPPPAQQLNESEPPPASEVEEEAMNPPGSEREPRRARDAAAVRPLPPGSTWTRLDVDGDGRVSAAEGRADAAFSAGFGASDSNDDGFVSEAEFRAKAGSREGEADRDGINGDRDD